ncbi:hypothetical protein NDU88_002347 [Pleurodeles waltl]|uniref:Uncharacterized protein n=1 Tax=Pleurodeles waltl TaxID=8319 RepID=A0AAV7T304_PLEWA|nr:hypothetical protein NDU88_002347 [Pleurodeles waltl]
MGAFGTLVVRMHSSHHYEDPERVEECKGLYAVLQRHSKKRREGKCVRSAGEKQGEAGGGKKHKKAQRSTKEHNKSTQEHSKSTKGHRRAQKSQKEHKKAQVVKKSQNTKFSTT